MRVLVTRPEPGATRTVRRLAALGHEAMVAPVLRIAPVAGGRPEGRFDAVAFTSPNAVSAFPGAVLHCPAFTVGPRTATEARRAGWQDVTDCAGDAQALAAALAQALPGGARVLHPAGEDQAADLGALLAPSGIRVETRIVYRACPMARLDADAAAALRAGRLDAALHFSPRTARILLACVEAGGLMEPFGRLRHFCLSPAIASVLEAAHIPVTVAVEPNEDALIAVLASGRAGEPEVAP
ncbi:MAG: hypothetical protein B7Y70_02865 [Rhizobiales bacterium 35-68-8]|nr:MAG: hypothetical protein B7Y70_02865 [Rhizobiales bacterium 35-68-8]